MEIGQKVRVRRIRDRVPAELVSRLQQSPVGVIKAFKIVDGKGLGVIVQFGNDFSTWFFEDEVQPEA